MTDQYEIIAAHIAELEEEARANQWAQADLFALASQERGGLKKICESLEDNHGISKTMQTARNYADMGLAFPEDKRDPAYSWALHWEALLGSRKWEGRMTPVEVMDWAIEQGWSAVNLRNYRLYGDAEYKKPKIEKCEECGGDLSRCEHHYNGDEDTGQARGLEQRATQLAESAED